MVKFQGSVLFPLSRKSQERFLTKNIPILTITPCSHKWGVMPMKAVNRAGLKYRSQVIVFTNTGSILNIHKS